MMTARCLPMVFAARGIGTLMTVVIAAVAIASPGGSVARAATDGRGFEHVHALAVSANGHTLFLGAHSGLFRSEDGGRSWQRIALPATHPHVDVMAVTPHPEDANVVYITTHDDGVMKTTDAGTTWRKANAGLGGLDVHGLAVDPREPRKLHAMVRDKGAGLGERDWNSNDARRLVETLLAERR